MSTEDATSAKLEAALATLREHDNTLRELVSALRGVMGEDGLLARFSDLQARVAILERDRERAKGIIVAIGTFAGVVGAAITMVIDHFKP
jgi:signal transduction histidine kinase